MVRYCAVPNCKSNDTQVLSHRFPRNIKLANEWRNALELFNISVDELVKRYVVCTKHFERNAYRNPSSNYLNFTAVPKLNFTSNTEHEQNHDGHQMDEEIEENTIELNIIPENTVHQLEDDDGQDNQNFGLDLNVDRIKQEKPIGEDDVSTIIHTEEVIYDAILDQVQVNKQPKEYPTLRKYLPVSKRKFKSESTTESTPSKCVLISNDALQTTKQKVRLLKPIVIQKPIRLVADRSEDQKRNTNLVENEELFNERERLNLLTKEELIDEVLKARIFIKGMNEKLCQFLNK